MKKKKSFGFYILLILLIGFAIFLMYRMMQPKIVKVSENNVVKFVVDKKVKYVEVKSLGPSNPQFLTIEGYVNDKGVKYKFVSVVSTSAIDGIKFQLNELIPDFKIVNVPYSQNFWLNFLLQMLPFVLFLGLMIWLANKQTGDVLQGAGRNNAKMTIGGTVRFNDVAGLNEEKKELEEVVDFLKNPSKYNNMGVRLPKGVLLSGPPGTGKTLLAKAVAGESGVPFFYTAGSQFVEMFVGSGTARLRDLFKEAKKNAPCIIFIDELDAIGRKRNTGFDTESEKTLNQLLVELDGFDASLGIVIMGATNLAEMLDEALLRSGRFDRKIIVNLPDLEAREAILKVHARNKRFSEDVNIKTVAKVTHGFSGADLENTLNEAALLAARENRQEINMRDIDEAIDRVQMGPAKINKKQEKEEKKLIAYHEAGHATIGLLAKNASVVQKVTIIPRGNAGGYNLFYPEKEYMVYTKEQLEDQILGLLGGRVAEEVFFNTKTSGASNDLERATRLARVMVKELGMSDIGIVTYGTNQSSYGRAYYGQKEHSEKMEYEIDLEVNKIMNKCHKEATRIIEENKELLEKIAYYLVELETLNRDDIDEIFKTGHLKRYDELKECESTNI